MCYILYVTDREFLRRAKRYAKRNKLSFEFEPAKGKGSHGRLRLGTGETTVSRGELKTGTYHAMLKQLGISKEEF